jgi:hypothetical protein
MTFDPYKVTPAEMAYVAEYYEGYVRSKASFALKKQMAAKAQLYRQYEREKA